MPQTQDGPTSPLIGMIVARTLEALAQHDEFNEPVVRRLRELADSGGLEGFQAVMAALSGNQED